MRVIRLVIGIMIIAQGIYENEWLFILLGGSFSLMPLFNVGCSSCNMSIRKDVDDHTLDVVYEEVGNNTSSTD